MKLAVVLALLAFGMTHDYEESGDVIVLTDDNFDRAISEFSSGFLVKFYAPWCGHCKKLAPDYSRAAKILKSQDPPIYIAEVDATVATKTAEKYGVKGYPTIKFFVNGNPTEYQGGRQDKEIVNWVNKKMGPPVVALADQNDFRNFQAKNQFYIVFFGDSTNSNFKEFENACRVMDSFFCVSLKDEEVAKENGAQLNQIVLFKPFDEGKNVYDGQYSQAEIQNFISSNSVPLVSEFDNKLIQLVFTDGNLGLFLFRENKDQSLDQVLRQVAPKLKGQAYVTYSQISDGLGKRLGDFVGIKPDQLPSVWLIQPTPGQREMKKFPMSGDINEQNILKFVENFKKGDLRAQLKSQDIPAQPLENGVRVLVGKNFKEVAYDQNKDVLVKFYAPWCGHCKKLAPEYEQAAQELAHVDTLVLAKLDATENDVEGIEISGFPTLKFFPAGSSRSVEYNGPRDAAGIKNWLKSQVTHKFKLKEEL